MYLLFYSKKCKYSKKFVEVLYDIGEQDFFTMVDVAKVNGKYPVMVKKYGIKEVPTALIDGQLLVGPQAFKWLEGKIKNMNHQVSSQNTRANKTPVISGYIQDNSSSMLNEGDDHVEGTSSFSPLFREQKIETPDAGTDYEKTPFILPGDSITGGSTLKDDRPDRTSRMESDLEKMMAQRELDTPKKLRQY